MKHPFTKTLLCALASLGLAATGHASTLSGVVYCDANQNQTIDVDDVPLPGVEVVTEHESGFNRSDHTAANGEYLIDNLFAGTWVSDLTPGTLPADASIVGLEIFVYEISDTNLFESHDWLIDSAICAAPFCGDGILDDGEACDDGNNVDGDGCSATCQDEGGEGCTPGYWKQAHHFDSWTAPYTPDTLFSDVFEDAFPGMTLHQVLRQGGGGLKALGRHVVAALLNTASDGVSYGASTSEVVDGFDATFPGRKSDYNGLKGDLESMNEMGCPLN